jgi:hypothetical protein
MRRFVPPLPIEHVDESVPVRRREQVARGALEQDVAEAPRGLVEAPFAWTPPGPTLRRAMLPSVVFFSKMSVVALASPATRFVALLWNGYRPAERCGRIRAVAADRLRPAAGRADALGDLRGALELGAAEHDEPVRDDERAVVDHRGRVDGERREAGGQLGRSSSKTRRIPSSSSPSPLMSQPP